MNNKISFSFPQNHHEIVSTLGSGRFVLFGESMYEEIMQNRTYYEEFFAQSFQIQLINQNELFYLMSPISKEEKSKKIMLVLAIYVYEINLIGKNIYESLFSYNTLQSFTNIINESSYSKMCRGISIEGVIQECKRRNIVHFINDDSFIFTKAIEVFLDYAKSIAEVEKS